MECMYLKSDGTAGTFKEQHRFTSKAIAEQAVFDHDGVLETSSWQPGIKDGDYSLIPCYGVRLTKTCLDRAMARNPRLTRIQVENMAERLVQPVRGARYDWAPEGEQFESTQHRLHFTRALGYDFVAYFTSSTCGQFVRVRTVNWKFEDEIHGSMQVVAARDLWRRMVHAGYEAF